MGADFQYIYFVKCSLFLLFSTFFNRGFETQLWITFAKERTSITTILLFATLPAIPLGLTGSPVRAFLTAVGHFYSFRPFGLTLVLQIIFCAMNCPLYFFLISIIS